MTFLKAEWAVPIITVLGLSIAKVWSWFHKSNSNHIDKFKVIGNIENEMRDDLMSRLKSTEDRLDKLLLNYNRLNITVTEQTVKISQLNQLVKNRERRITDLVTSIKKLVLYINETDNKINKKEIEKIIKIANV